MIFTHLNSQSFAFDILLHSFFSLAIITIIFTYRTTHVRREDLLKIFKETIETGGVVGNTSGQNVPALNTLERIYNNRDKFDEVSNKDIKKTSINLLIIFAFSIFVTLFIVNLKPKELLAVFVDKIITFVIMGCTIYFYHTIVRDRYKEFLREDIYKIFQETITKLKI